MNRFTEATGPGLLRQAPAALRSPEGGGGRAPGFVRAWGCRLRPERTSASVAEAPAKARGLTRLKLSEKVMQQTLSIIKPDGVRQKVAGKVLARIEETGFKILGLRMIRMSKSQAEGFYAVHKARPFFGSLTDFMSSGPSIVMVLEKENAVEDLRKLMGATDPGKAEPGTIRKEYATSIEANIIHGSDSPESAAIEIPYFFTKLQLIS